MFRPNTIFKSSRIVGNNSSLFIKKNQIFSTKLNQPNVVFESKKRLMGDQTAKVDADPKLLELGRLNHVAIAVPNLEEASNLYKNVLGAKVSDAVVILN